MQDLIISKFPDVIDVVAVKPLVDFTVLVTFSDGTQRNIDLEPYLHGPIFEPIRNDAEMFRRIFIDHGALAWHNGADIDTDTLYYNGAPPWAEQSRNVPAHSTRTSRSISAKRRHISQRPTSPSRRRAKVASR